MLKLEIQPLRFWRRFLGRPARRPIRDSLVALYVVAVAAVCLVVLAKGSPLLSAVVAAQLVIGLSILRRHRLASVGVRALLERVRTTGESGLLPAEQEYLRGLGEAGTFVRELIDALAAAKKAVLDDQLQIINSIALAVEAKDPNTQGHCLRVRHWTRRILNKLGGSPEFREAVERAALLHDVGKIGVPDSVLLKRGKLLPAEYSRIMMHVEAGVEILKPLASLQDVALYVKHHHEKYDGTGYPDRLKGEEIPLASRIIAVADTIDAMRSSRPYRAALSLESIIAELERVRGKQLDPQIVDVAVSILRPSSLRQPLAAVPERRQHGAEPVPARARSLDPEVAEGAEDAELVVCASAQRGD